jgi:hypothetical protein
MVGLISAGTATLIGAGLSAAAAGAGTIASISAADKNAAAQGRAVDQARAGSAQQIALQNEILRQQREFQTATQVDADGNRIIYDPNTNSWIPLLSERGLQMQASQRAAQETEARKYFGRQQGEEAQNFARRQEEGGASRQLLDQIRNQYGAPTREGAVGAAKIAGVTPAGETAENLKSGAAASTLRTGGSMGTLGAQFNAVDRNAASGQRSALAQVDAAPNYADDILDKWRAGKLGSYTPLASRASNIANVAAPDSGQQALTAQIAQRAARPFNVSPYAGATTNAANKDLVAALAADKNTFPTGAYGAFGETIKTGIKDYFDWQDKNKPITRPGEITRTSSKQYDF